MKEGILSLGDKIQMKEILRTLNDEKQEKVPVYTSQILEFDEDEEDVLNIAMPISEGKLIPLEVGRKFELFFYAKKGMYTCRAEITNRYKSNNLYILTVSLLSDLVKYQRRQFFRLKTSFDVQYKLFTEEDEKYFRLMGKMSEDMLQRPFSVGTCIDISGGGIRFHSRDNLQKGDKLLVRIELVFDNQVKICDAVSKVIFSARTKARSDVFENRVEFAQIKEEDRELIIKYIFKEERNLRRKMLE